MLRLDDAVLFMLLLIPFAGIRKDVTRELLTFGSDAVCRMFLSVQPDAFRFGHGLYNSTERTESCGSSSVLYLKVQLVNRGC